ncbi:DnaJ domain [Musa troglodytarum]|uniref:DnaJ domain n=1 Tax=Musa troglodytarum TaxID=320322 RepID=A0A9E7EQ67_9LILI|nr:DnaJ domain [Musa troglodytarum]
MPLNKTPPPCDVGPAPNLGRATVSTTALSISISLPPHGSRTKTKGLTPFPPSPGSNPILLSFSFPRSLLPSSASARWIPADRRLQRPLRLYPHLDRPSRAPMDDFPGILARDFGFRPQGKSVPMAASKAAASSGGGSANFEFGSGSSSAANGSWGNSRSGWNPNSDSDPWLGDRRVEISESRSPPAYDDVFGGPARPSNRSASSSPPPAFDSIFDGYNKDAAVKPSSSSSLPVYDKPVYDDDIFDGVPGVKSSSSFKYDDVFGSMSSGSNNVYPPPYEDLLANLGKPTSESKGTSYRGSAEEKNQDLSGFDDLIPGFGGSSPPKKREFSVANEQKPAVSSAKPPASTTEDPFVVLESKSPSTYSPSGFFADPLEHISRPENFGSMKGDASSNNSGIPDDSIASNGVSRSEPFFTTETNDVRRDKSPLKGAQNMSSGHRTKPSSQSPMDAFANILPKMQTNKPSYSEESGGSSGFQSSDTVGRNISGKFSESNEQWDRAEDVWLTVDEVPLFTQPTTAPPPSRPPPRLVINQAPSSATVTRKGNEFYPQSTHTSSHHNESRRKPVVSPIDELEDFVMAKPQMPAQDHSDIFTGEEEIETNSAAAASAAAMKEAMDRAEAKFKHAREVRERERDSKFAKNRESMLQEDLEDTDTQERLNWEQEQKEREYKEERKRLEKEREKELERERERHRQAVERATREARERAAAEARVKAERAAVEKANAEARQRAERAAVQRAAAEARERAAAEARERAEKEARERAERAAAEAKERAAVEAREKAAAAAARERAAVDRAAAEARRRAERAAVERAAAEARERAAAEARERAAAAAREKQQKPENDLESFFGMGARATSAPKERATPSEAMFDGQTQNKGGFDATRRTSSSYSSVRKTASSSNFADDLASIFGGPPSSGEFQEIEGESEERRRARLERHQRTLERAAKALAEKNERDMQTQREQAERHRIAETQDIEIKRWASGKEGNLRALLSTLQYVLWPECGWQPVSLIDLITAAAVKKVYRKATLCIHPDKVQQKGATLQQKYIAEKVFDLLKEAWNKFNSEELF